jgi:hypothetical protein
MHVPELPNVRRRRAGSCLAKMKVDMMPTVWVVWCFYPGRARVGGVVLPVVRIRLCWKGAAPQRLEASCFAEMPKCPLT